MNERNDVIEIDLQKLLKVPYRCPFPDCSDREEWARVADEDRRAILEAASEAKKKPYPEICPGARSIDSGGKL